MSSASIIMLTGRDDGLCPDAFRDKLLPFPVLAVDAILNKDRWWGGLLTKCGDVHIGTGALSGGVDVAGQRGEQKG